MAKKAGQQRVTNLPTVYPDRMGKLTEKSPNSNVSNNLNYIPGETIIKNPNMLEVAQSLRGSFINSSPSTIEHARQRGESPLIAERVYKTTDRAKLTGKLLISDDDISNGVVNVRLNVVDDRGFKIEKHDFQIDHNSMKSSVFMRSIPPIFNASYQHDENIIKMTATQRDQLANKICIFLREIDIEGTQKFEIFTELNITSNAGESQIDKRVTLGRPTILRAISKRGQVFCDSFVDVVLFPGEDKTIDVKNSTASNATIPSRAILSAHCVTFPEPLISINVDSILTEAIRFSLVKRCITSSEREFKNVISGKIVNLLIEKGTSFSFSDTDVLDGFVYEYRCKFTMPSGIEYLSDLSVIQKYIKAQQGASFIIENKSNTSPVKKNREYITSFDIVPILESSQVANVKAILNRIKPGLYSSKFSNMSDFLNTFVAFKCQRTNTNTGDVSDLGIYPPGKFYDHGNIATGVKPPRAGVKYIYKIEMIMRDIFQVIEETKNIASKQAEKQARKNPTAYGQKSQQDFSISTRSKHFSPTALKDSTLAYGDALVCMTSGQSIELGRTGVQQIVTITTSKRSCRISRSTVKQAIPGCPLVSWSVVGQTETIDHFIIMANRDNYTYPCGVTHHKPSLGNSYSFLDRTQTICGSVSYSIFLVYTDYTRSAPHKVGSVTIYK